jgi:hypothetical protein
VSIFSHASLPNWILIKRQTELTKRESSTAAAFTYWIKIFRSRNWLIGLFLSEYLLGFDDENFFYSYFLIKLFTFGSVHVWRSMEDCVGKRVKEYEIQSWFPPPPIKNRAFLISVEGLATQTHVHIISSKNKVIDAGTQYSGEEIKK